MIKVKYIALALVLCLGLIGGAYAWWTDQLVVEGTVNTGHLEMAIQSGVYLHLELPEHMDGTKDVTNEGKTAAFTINNVYPQEAGTNYRMPHVIRLRPVMVNESSMAVRLGSVDLDTCGNDAWNYMRAHLDVGGPHVDGASTRWGPGDKLGLPGSDTYNLTRYHGIPFNSLPDYIMQAMDGEVLEPGQIVRLSHPKDASDSNNSIRFWLDVDTLESGEKENAFQNLENLSFTLTFNWVQHNAP